MENNKNVVRLTESQLNELINESIQQILEEGFFDNLKAGLSGAVQGARRGFQGQKMLDRGTDNFKQNWDYDDFKAHANPYGPGAENTASMQANQTYNLYREYQQEANKYLNLYKSLIKKYNLAKEKPGQTQTREETAHHTPNSRIDKNKFGNKDARRNKRTTLRYYPSV